MQTETLRVKAKEILQYLREVPYSNETVRYYECCYENLFRYCESCPRDRFDHEVADAYSSFQKQCAENGEMSIIYALTLRKAAFVLADFLLTGTIDWKRRTYGARLLTEEYSTLLNNFKDRIAESLSPGSVALVVQTVRHFLFFLEDMECRTISDLKDTSLIREFIIREAPKHVGNRVNLTWPIKKFMAYLVENGRIAFDAGILFVNPVPNRKKVLPCFEDEELDTLFNAVDTTTAIGRRDLAIMKLALSTGIRSIDLRNLKLADIDWHRNEIHIVQDKTDTEIVVPLLPDAGNAVADYILNARPKSDEPYVFLRTRMPYTKLAVSSNGANILKRWRKGTRLEHAVGDGKTFHALRRTAGTNMIRSGATLSLASQFLGHNSPDSTRRYLSLHDEMLAECCTDMGHLRTRKDGLV